MSATDLLKRKRYTSGSPAEIDSQGLEAPMVDPTMLLASLFGPGLMRGLMRGASRGGVASAASAAPQFDRTEMLLARLKANQPRVKGNMVAEKLPAFLSNRAKTFGVQENLRLPSMSPMDRPTGPIGAQIPPIDQPLEWLLHPRWQTPTGNNTEAWKAYGPWINQMYEMVGRRMKN